MLVTRSSSAAHTLKDAYIKNNWLLDTEKEDLEDIEEIEEEPKDKESPLDNGIKFEEEPDYRKLYFELLAKQNKEEIKQEIF